MEKLTVTLRSDDEITRNDMIDNYRDLELYLKQELDGIEFSELIENKQSIDGARGDSSTFKLILELAPGCINLTLVLIELWNKKKNSASKSASLVAETEEM